MADRDAIRIRFKALEEYVALLEPMQRLSEAEIIDVWRNNIVSALSLKAIAR